MNSHSFAAVIRNGTSVGIGWGPDMTFSTHLPSYRQLPSLQAYRGYLLKVRIYQDKKGHEWEKRKFKMAHRCTAGRRLKYTFVEVKLEELQDHFGPQKNTTALGIYPWAKGCRRLFEKDTAYCCFFAYMKNQCYAQGANQQYQPGSTALKIMHLRYRANTKAKTWAALTAWEKVGSLF